MPEGPHMGIDFSGDYGMRESRNGVGEWSMDNTMDRTESKFQDVYAVSSLDHCPMDRVDLKLKVGAITSTFPWLSLGASNSNIMEAERS